MVPEALSPAHATTGPSFCVLIFPPTVRLEGGRNKDLGGEEAEMGGSEEGQGHYRNPFSTESDLEMHAWKVRVCKISKISAVCWVCKQFQQVWGVCQCVS